MVLANRSVDPDGSGLDLLSVPAKPALDLHKGISTPRALFDGARAQKNAPDPLFAGCLRWPEHLRLLNLLTGQLFPGRCKCTNLCRYCQRLYVVETVEMLTLDALEHPPTLWAVLTAREHLTRPDTYLHLEKLRRSLRRRWPALEWFVQVEFQRRGALHLNLLVKGVPVDDLAEFYRALTRRWCARVDAKAGPFDAMKDGGQWAGAVENAGGVVRYLSKMLAHGLKAEQAPPIGWKGHRTSQTRGYLVRPASVMREEARAALRQKRALHAAIEAGHDAHDAELVAHQALELAAATEWKLVQLYPLAPGPEPRWRHSVARRLRPSEPDVIVCADAESPRSTS